MHGLVQHDGCDSIVFYDKVLLGWLDDYRFLIKTSSGFFSPSYLPFENGPYLNSLVPAELRPEAGRTRQCC